MDAFPTPRVPVLELDRLEAGCRMCRERPAQNTDEMAVSKQNEAEKVAMYRQMLSTMCDALISSELQLNRISEEATTEIDCVVVQGAGTQVADLCRCIQSNLSQMNRAIEITDILEFLMKLNYEAPSKEMSHLSNSFIIILFLVLKTTRELMSQPTGVRMTPLDIIASGISITSRTSYYSLSIFRNMINIFDAIGDVMKDNQGLSSELLLERVTMKLESRPVKVPLDQIAATAFRGLLEGHKTYIALQPDPIR